MRSKFQFLAFLSILLTATTSIAGGVNTTLYTCHNYSKDSSGNSLEAWNEQFEIGELTSFDESGITSKRYFLDGSNLWHGNFEVQLRSEDGFSEFFSKEKGVNLVIEPRISTNSVSKESHYFGKYDMFRASLQEPLTSRWLICFSEKKSK